MVNPDVLIKELVEAIPPLDPTAIVVHELPPNRPEVFHEKEARAAGCNWTINIGPQPVATEKRYHEEVKKLRVKYPKLDWKGVTDQEGDRRLVQRFVTNGKIL